MTKSKPALTYRITRFTGIGTVATSGGDAASSQTRVVIRTHTSARSYDLCRNERHPQAPLAVAQTLSETFDLGPTRLRVALAAEEATVLEAEIEPGGGSSWHAHTKEDETLVVLEGELVLTDDDRHVLQRGDAHVVPRGRRHAFANESNASVRLYFFCAPGGLERFFRDIASGVPAEQAASRAGLILG